MKVLGLGAVVATLTALGLLAWPAAVEAGVLLGACAAIWAICLVLWWRGTYWAAQAVAAFDAMARTLGLARCRSLPWQGDGRGASNDTAPAPANRQRPFATAPGAPDGAGPERGI